MAGTLLPARVALERYFPDAATVMAIPGGVDPDNARVLLVEGDLVIDRAGLIQTTDIMPEVTAALGEDELLVAIAITGNFTAPDLVLLEPDIDWSPRFRIAGDMQVRSLCLGGSASVVEGNLTVSDTLFGHYNHGRLQVGGDTRATTILASDYEFDFGGKVTADYVLSDSARLNVKPAYEREQFHLVLDAELIDDENCVKDGEIIRRLKQGEPILRPKKSIGKKPKRALGRLGKERIAAIMARAQAGEAITAIDLTRSELRFVPEEIQRFKGLRELRLSKNEVKTLPDWIGEFEDLAVLDAEDCGLKTLPAVIGELPKLRRLCVEQNDLKALPRGFPALEHLRVGGSYNDRAVDFVANLDLAPFPALRYAELTYAGLPTLTYGRQADQWNAPALEYLDIGCKLKGLPDNLFRAKRLKGLAITLTAAAIDTALDLTKRLPDLELLSLGYENIPGAEIQAIAATLSGVLVRARYCLDFRIEMEHPLYRLNSSLGSAVHAGEFAKAAPMAEQLLGQLDLDRPRYEAEFIESALRNCIDAFIFDAGASEGAVKDEKVMRAAALADRILAILPKTAALCWLLHQRDLGLLRLACLIAQANRHLHRSDPAAATAVLDAAQDEIDLWIDTTNAWFMRRAGAISAMRAKVAAFR
jgi:hypothetical protein